MEPTKVGVREFRDKLAYFLEAKTPVAITRHGETVGLYIPTRRRTPNRDLTALKAAAAQVDAMLEAAGISEDELVEDFKRLRKANAKR
ncbi:MAG: prevent-host-death protein [Acidobacteriaceae bacterium]|nr:prevent-host-death protein [Acidobacteriaceae bacterium]